MLNISCSTSEMLRILEEYFNLWIYFLKSFLIFLPDFFQLILRARITTAAVAAVAATTVYVVAVKSASRLGIIISVVKFLCVFMSFVIAVNSIVLIIVFNVCIGLDERIEHKWMVFQQDGPHLEP